jgi:hypothetical protein
MKDAEETAKDKFNKRKTMKLSPEKKTAGKSPKAKKSPRSKKGKKKSKSKSSETIPYKFP